MSSLHTLSCKPSIDLHTVPNTTISNVSEITYAAVTGTFADKIKGYIDFIDNKADRNAYIQQDPNNIRLFK